MKKFKKLIAAILVVVMCACYAPLCAVTSSAADEAVEAVEAQDETYNMVIEIVNSSVTVLLNIITSIFKLLPFGSNAGSNNGNILNIVLNATKLIYNAANKE